MHGQAMHPPQDDGFDAAWHMKATNSDAERIVPENPNTVPARPRRHKTAPSDSSSHSQTTAMPNARPSCEKRSGAARKSPTELRRPSIGSSSEDSTTKTRSRGHGSRHSSRRTSRTFVDPSRPTRHYRINSSHTVPTANRNDIDDVIALHFRSCSLFENPTYYSPMASPTGDGYLETAMGSKHPHTVPEWTDDITSNHHDVIENKPLKTTEETIASPERENTTMHWMSPSTRKRQYEKIDRANSGLRGFVAKVVPRCVSGPPPEKFYEKDKSDTGSVRRYRMSDDCEDEEERDAKQGKDLEKSTSTVRPRQIRTLDRAATAPQAKTKRWGCF